MGLKVQTLLLLWLQNSILQPSKKFLVNNKINLMKKILILLIVTVFFVSCDFRSPETKEINGKIGTAYGKPFDYSLSISVPDLMVLMQTQPKVDTVIIGKIKSANNGEQTFILEGDSSKTIFV